MKMVHVFDEYDKYIFIYIYLFVILPTYRSVGDRFSCNTSSNKSISSIST